MNLAHSFPLLAAMALGLALPAAAEEATQSLDQAASDPTASLMAVQIQNLYSGDYYNLNSESGNSLLLRTAIPFQAFDVNNIARISLPVITSGPNGSGLGDMTVFNLATFNQSWGRWGVGAVMLVPVGTNGLSADKWALGPAVGFSARQPGLLWGAFNQNLFSFAGSGQRDVRVSILQPILNISLPDKWSIGASEMNLTYDWERSAWSALPLGIKLAKLTKFGELPVQLAGSYEYNFVDDYVAPKWTLTFTAKFLFPLGL
jgi:hypothetical protein